ncbi:MAG: D-alanyl-D-alanine carboxypeptidase/D-alanyl-D-alanine-endopeptidase [Massilia sp.]
MSRRPALTALAALLLCLPMAARAELPEPVSRAMAAAGMPSDSISALVLRGNTAVLSHLAERPMNPASTMKLVTTMVALEQLGPTFRGRTELRSTAPLADGVLKGDLILRGGADIDFSGEVLERMLRALRNQGVNKIAGNFVLDRSLFNPPRNDIGVPPFDEYGDAYYNVIPDALLVNKNMLQIELRSTARHLQLAIEPALDKLELSADMTLIDADCAAWEAGWKAPEIVRDKVPHPGGKMKLVLKGTFPKNCARTNSINVLDRNDYLDRLFRITWKQVGGTFAGETVEGRTPQDARLLAEHASRALPELVRDTNKLSDNALARTLFLSLGSVQGDPLLGSRPIPYADTETTFVRADQAVRVWLRNHGIDDTGLVLENGSGLSRLERISPLQLASLLQAGQRSLWAPELQASMPIVGLDGTMRRRLPNSPAALRSRMKTGTLNGVAAVAGYVTDASGQQCVVVAMLNNEFVSGGRGTAVLDALVDWVARSGG